MPALNRLYRDYRDRVAFHVVYIEEAHPIDAWQLEDNVKDGVLFKTTRTAEERDAVAHMCVVKLGIDLFSIRSSGWSAFEYLDYCAKHKAKVVPRTLVLGFGVAETDDQPVARSSDFR